MLMKNKYYPGNSGTSGIGFVNYELMRVEALERLRNLKFRCPICEKHKNDKTSRLWNDQKVCSGCYKKLREREC